MNLIKNISSFFDQKNKKRIFKNLYSSVAQIGSRSIIQLIFPPLMIASYGINDFGVWIFLTSIPSILSLFDVNINTASRIEMSISYNKKKYLKVKSIYINSLVLTIVYILFLFVASLLIVLNFNFQIEILKNINSDQLKLIILFVFFVFFLNTINSYLKSSITYKGNLDLENYIEIFYDFLIKSTIIIFGFIYSELFYAVVIYTAINFIKFLTYLYYRNKFDKTLNNLDLKNISVDEILNLFKLSIPYYFETVRVLAKNNLQIILLGFFFGPVIVGLVSTMKTFFYFFPLRIWDIQQRILMYEYTRFYSLKNFIFLKKLFNNILKLYFYFILFYSIIFIFFGKQIYDFWTKNNYEISILLIVFVCLDFIFDSLGGTFKTINKSINKIFKLSLFGLIVNIGQVILLFAIFNLNFDFFYIFIINSTGSLIMLFYSFYIYKNLINTLK